MLKRIRLLLALLLPLMLVCAAANAASFGYYNGDTESNRVAITVDDCYSQEQMERILDLCEQYDFPVTFFLVGSAINPEWRGTYMRALSLGCELGNHTFSHMSLPSISDEAIITQLRRTETALDDALGFHYQMNYMRPPYGNVNRQTGPSIVSAVKKAGYQGIILWNVSQTDPAKCIGKVKNGCIMLFHTIAKDSLCLETLVPQILERGFEPVTISTLLGIPMPAWEQDGVKVTPVPASAPAEPTHIQLYATPEPTPEPTPMPTPEPAPLQTPAVLRVIVRTTPPADNE